MEIIPLDAVPAQTVAFNTDTQAVRVRVYQKITGLFIDVLVSEVLVVGGVLCHDRCLIVRSAYLGFSGDLTFIDNQGLTDPVYTGLGGQYSLAWLSPDDVEIVGVAA